MSDVSSFPKRIAFVLNALTKGELIAGNRDTARVYSLLTDPNVGDCEGITPVHNCSNLAEFLNYFNTLLDTWNITNQLIFYFSGHGEIRRGVYGLKFGPSRSDFYPFKNFMNDLEAGGVGRAIIILDTCHSGAAVKEKSEYDPLATIEQQALPQGIAIIASSRSTEGSRELPDGSNSVFTELLCKGIETGLEGKKTPDGMIYVGDIVGYITSKLTSDDKYKAFRQRPVFSVNAFEKDIWVAKNQSGRVSEQVRSNEPRMVQNPEELLLLYERTVPTEHPCPNATLADLDWTLVSKYAKKVDSDLDVSSRDEAILSTLKFFSSIPYDGRICLHQSAVLCFARRPETMYSSAKAIFVVGNPRDKDFIREDITCPLSVQVEQLVQRIFKEVPRISSISESGLREERPELDFELVRELISNAIAHRDYEQGGTVKVTLKPNVLEIQSPGKFPDGISWQVLLESAEHPVSLPVNGAIAHYLSNLLGFEGIGRGFDVIRSYIQQNGPESIECKDLPGPTTLVRVWRRKSINMAPLLPNFIMGREDDIAALAKRLTGEMETTLLTAVRGWPGIGKTTLAAALAHDDKLKDTFSDGVLWISLGQKPDIRLGLGNWLMALGETLPDDSTSEARHQRLAALLQQKKMLLIVDDVWDAADAQSFLVGGKDCRVLITTRQPKVARDLGLPEEAIYNLQVLSQEDSLELLRKIAPSVVNSDLEGVKKLVNELEGLPLALHVAGRLLAEEAELGLGVSELLAELVAGSRILEEQAPADRFDLATQTTPTVATLFKRSTDRLDEETRDRFAMLGVFVPKPATFDSPAVAAAWGVDDPRPTLRTLLARGLIEPAPNERFQMHALLAVHARTIAGWETD